MQLWVRRDCEIEHVPYQTGQKLDVSEALGTHLQRCSPESFTDVDPAATLPALTTEGEVDDTTNQGTRCAAQG
jgi:hypothetical protein